MTTGATRRSTTLGLLFFGGYDPDYPRNAIIRKGWLKCGLPLTECRVGLHLKVHLRYPALLWRYQRLRERGTVLFVPDFRHKDVPLAWMLAKLTGRKLVFDPLVSRYETRVLDRGDAAEDSVQAWHNRNIDRASFRLPDLLLADTDAHARFYTDTFGIRPERIRTLHLGYDDDFFSFHPPRGVREQFEVLFYGTYLPLHGADVIVEAASILRSEPVAFTLIGRGQTFEEVAKRAAGIPNITFQPAVPLQELELLIADADTTLGVFGRTAKATHVIPNKVFQSLAVGRPVITADTPAIHELFTNGEHLLTVPPGDPGALARAIRMLVGEPGLRTRLAESGGALVRRHYSPAAVAKRLAAILEEMSGW
jgi:glycosyltransferase involved in cell wall biosynthesis